MSIIILKTKEKYYCMIDLFSPSLENVLLGMLVPNSRDRHEKNGD